MTFRADGTSVVNVVDGNTSGVALAFDPNMARHIAAALNKYLPGAGGRGKTDPLTGETVDKLDFTDSRTLSEVLGKDQVVKVVGPYATAMMGTPDGRQVRSLAEGATLPSDVTAGHARHLIDVGLAKVVETGPARPAPEEPTAQGPETPPTDPNKPARNDPKEDWAAYAVAQRPEGVPEEQARAEVESWTKAELIARFG